MPEYLLMKTALTRAIETDTLPNGLVVITEPMDHLRSVAVGVWIRSGSRREPAEVNGIAHFIEHMVFKGTGRRSAQEIAREVDRVGGMLDAFTAKEMVGFHTRVLDEHLPQAFDVLSDLVLDPQFPDEEISREKSVILEEIKMAEDNPEDLVHELFTQNFWRDHPLGKPILGTRETVGNFDRDKLRVWFSRWYAPDNMIVTAAGHVSHAQMMGLSARFADRPAVKHGPADSPAAAAPRITLKNKRELEQVHICIGVEALPIADSRRFAASVLNNILGGGMSSRLFQNIREKQGLAYAVFSEISPYRDTGLLSVYAGTARETPSQVIASVMAEFRAMKEELVSEEELRRAKDHLKGAMLLSLESPGTRMSNLARHYMYFERFFTPEELIAELEAVTREEVRKLAGEFFKSGRIAATVVGNLDGFRLAESDLAF